MSLSDAAFKRFVGRLRPTDGQLKVCKSEIDNIRDNLPELIRADDTYHFVKVLQSGSYAKNTLLRRHAEGDFDVDVALYFAKKGATKQQLNDMLNYIEAKLRKLYEGRTKRRARFSRATKSSVRVEFRENPKLNIDVVPVIEE